MATDEDTELLPCPWCGVVPIAQKIKGANYSLVGCNVAECPSADAMTPEQWNTRADTRTLSAAQQWQPIATAPKDGIVIIIQEMDGRVGDAVYLPRKDIWVSPDGAYGYDPVRWMPLPSAPVDELEKNSGDGQG